MNLVVTGGGTGGHVFGGIAIAQEFVSQSKANEVLFVGSAYGLETRLVPQAGYKLETLNVGKLVGQNPLKKIITLLQIPLAVLKCTFILRRFKADMVVGVGGYAAGPCILAARILGIPVGLLEQNSVMGFTNRISARLAQNVFTAFEGPLEGVPSAKRVVTGNPARSTLKPFPNKKVSPFVIFAFGGSQGATGINKMLTEAVQELHPFKDQIQIIHQTGVRDYEWVVQKYQELNFPAEVHKFIDDMQTMYDRASVVVCRAGSSTIAELGVTQNAAIFIPFPHAARNHQEINARLLEKEGAALVLTQGENTGRDLAKVLKDLIQNPEKLRDMRKRIPQFYKPDAARRIVDIMKTRVLTAR